jgi:NAD(P)-dependent dehydrogenase (short-subunit alcohol dehydrogenase family)
MVLQSGQVAVITGGATGIGYALAEAFARKGLRLAIADVDAEALRAAERKLRASGANVLAVQTDVAERDQVRALRESVVASFGTVDVLCNNAGVYHAVGPVWTRDTDGWRKLFAVNYWGVVHGIQEFVPLLLAQGSGHVLTTASMSGFTTVPGMAEYSSSKHAIISLTETLRADLDNIGATSIGVTLLCPAVVRTAMGERALGLLTDAHSAASANAVGSGPNLASVLEPADVAVAALQGIAAGKLYVMPTPDSKARFMKRVQPILNAFEA